MQASPAATPWQPIFSFHALTSANAVHQSRVVLAWYGQADGRAVTL
jgi:hypothetical protein